jgi:hypothetical protein
MPNTKKNSKFTHKWNGIEVTEYVYNVMSREVTSEYARSVKGNDTVKLIHTLRDVRWFGRPAVENNIKINKYQAEAIMRTQTSLTNSANVRDNTTVATTEEEGAPRKTKASID